MTQFTNVIPARLWQVNDLLSADHLNEIVSTDWQNLPWANSPQQQGWLRREIKWDTLVVQSISDYINSKLNIINQAVGTNFTHSSGQFWVDQPGFTVPMHTDGHLVNSLQMYWIAPNERYGTGFYQYNNQDTLLHQFKSIPNTGYFMLNHLDEDGSQPLHWHGMFNPVPRGYIRVSSYWQFN